MWCHCLPSLTANHFLPCLIRTFGSPYFCTYRLIPLTRSKLEEKFTFPRTASAFGRLTSSAPVLIGLNTNGCPRSGRERWGMFRYLSNVAHIRGYLRNLISFSYRAVHYLVGEDWCKWREAVFKFANPSFLRSKFLADPQAPLPTDSLNLPSKRAYINVLPHFPCIKA